jgi:predicted aspartyl protease
MRIDGSWVACDDGITRPGMLAEARAGDGSWVACRLLVDTAADRTVLCAHLLHQLRLTTLPSTERLAGVGGRVSSVLVQTQIRVYREDQSPVLFNGPFPATVAPESLEMSVLGRDLLDHFSLVVDGPRRAVCLVGPGHHYTIAPDRSR